jgi:hypothetical protein
MATGDSKVFPWVYAVDTDHFQRFWLVLTSLNRYWKLKEKGFQRIYYLQEKGLHFTSITKKSGFTEDELITYANSNFETLDWAIVYFIYTSEVAKDLEIKRKNREQRRDARLTKPNKFSRIPEYHSPILCPDKLIIRNKENFSPYLEDLHKIMSKDSRRNPDLRINTASVPVSGGMASPSRSDMTISAVLDSPTTSPGALSIGNANLIHFDMTDVQDIESFLLREDEDFQDKILTPGEKNTDHTIDSLENASALNETEVPKNPTRLNSTLRSSAGEDDLLKLKQGLLNLIAYFKGLESDPSVYFRDYVELLILMTKDEIAMLDDQLKLKRMRYEFEQLAQRRIEDQKRREIVRSTYKRN